MNEIEVRGAIERLENPNATAWFYSPEDDVKTVIEFAKAKLNTAEWGVSEFPLMARRAYYAARSAR